MSIVKKSSRLIVLTSKLSMKIMIAVDFPVKFIVNTKVKVQDLEPFTWKNSIQKYSTRTVIKCVF